MNHGIDFATNLNQTFDQTAEIIQSDAYQFFGQFLQNVEPIQAAQDNGAAKPDALSQWPVTRQDAVSDIRFAAQGHETVYLAFSAEWQCIVDEPIEPEMEKMMQSLTAIEDQIPQKQPPKGALPWGAEYTLISNNFSGKMFLFGFFLGEYHIAHPQAENYSPQQLCALAAKAARQVFAPTAAGTNSTTLQLAEKHIEQRIKAGIMAGSLPGIEVTFAKARHMVLGQALAQIAPAKIRCL